MMVQRPQLQLEKQKLTSLIEKQNQKQWGKRNNLNLTEIPVGPSSPCPTWTLHDFSPNMFLGVKNDFFLFHVESEHKVSR